MTFPSSGAVMRLMMRISVVLPTVGSEQAVNRPLGNRERHIVQSRMSGEALGNVFYFQYLHNRSKT